MTDLIVLKLVEKHLTTNQIVLTIEYDIENLINSSMRSKYNGEITKDRYGRDIPKHAHGTINLNERTSSTKLIMEAVEKLYERIINKDLLIRKIYVVVNNLISEFDKATDSEPEQMSLFVDYEKKKEMKELLKKENELQHAIINIRAKYGKNAILKGMNLEKDGTTIQRNAQIGGHKE